MMKNVILFLLSISILTLSCKKDKDPEESEPKNIASFSYGNYNETDANVSVTQLQGSLSLYIAKFTATTVRSSINVQIDNYNGPGTYTFGANVRVFADEANDEGYWEHFYYDFANTVYGAGTVVIKTLNDDRITATINGTLYHVDGTNPRTETKVKADIDKNY